METQEQFTLLLSGKRKKYHIDICADQQKLTATVSRDNSSLRISVLPRASDTDEYCTHVKATVSVTWKTMERGEQKASFSDYHEFAKENPYEWRLRLDAYLPLLEDSCDDFEGIIAVFLKEMHKGSDFSRSSVYPISSGVLKVEDELFPISKELFSVHSEFFSVLFNRSFKEKDMEVIPLKDVPRDSFEFLLNVITNGKRKPTKMVDCTALMEVADRLGMLNVMKSFETSLLSLSIQEKDVPLIVRYAEMFDRPDVLNHLLESFTSNSSLADSFIPVAAEISPTMVEVLQRVKSLSLIANNPSLLPKVWMEHPFFGDLRFELYYDQEPEIAWAFVRLMNCRSSGNNGARISMYVSSSNLMMCKTDFSWRGEEKRETIVRNVKGAVMLYTQSQMGFAFSEDGEISDGYIFGRLIAGDLTPKQRRNFSYELSQTGLDF